MNRSVLIAAVLGTLIMAACSKKEPNDSHGKVVSSLKGATVETVKQEPFEESFEAAGTIRSTTTAIVSPRIPGIIVSMAVKEGSRVKKGDILARLDARENQANAAAAEEAVEDARRALDESKARRALAVSQFERYQRLFKSDVISRQEFEIKGTEQELAVQGVARAEARLKQAQEQSSGAGAFADYTRITAPISGIITSRQADLGATVFPGQPLFTLEDEGGYQLELAIPESLSQKVSPGASVQVTLDALGSSFSAKIADVVPSADTFSRTFTAKIPLSQRGLKSGMFGRGAIGLGSRTTAIMLPKKALVERGALTSVWVLSSENILKMRIVKAGKTLGERVEILSGLADGERVLVGGFERVSEGMKVE